MASAGTFSVYGPLITAYTTASPSVLYGPLTKYSSQPP